MNNWTCQGWSRCNGIRLVYGLDIPNLLIIASAPTVTSSVFMPGFSLFLVMYKAIYYTALSLCFVFSRNVFSLQSELMSYSLRAYDLQPQSLWAIASELMSYSLRAYEQQLKSLWATASELMSYSLRAYELQPQSLWALASELMSYSLRAYELQLKSYVHKLKIDLKFELSEQNFCLNVS